MYYKHRPELIAFIEESVRAYRALAERYDKLSTDLQKANTTIASVFPDQLTYDTDYEDDDNNNGLRNPKNIGSDPPKAPKLPEGKIMKKMQAKKVTKDDHLDLGRLGLTKNEAIEEIDKLQKDILSMQTMKEFTKSSYENGVAKLWEIEKTIIEMQQRVCSLQDEFKVAKSIEDDDARVIMAEAALKSCDETLAKLQETQKKSTEAAGLEHERIQNMKQKLESLKHTNDAEKEEDRKLEKELWNSVESEPEIEENPSKKPLTVTELAETVDKLVNKVISLESLVSSQTVLIDRLKTESDDLQIQIRNLEDDKANLIDGTNNLGKTLKEMEKKLNGVQDLDQKIENQNNSIKMQFSQARCSLDHLSENLHNIKPDEDEPAKQMIMELEGESESQARLEGEDQMVIKIKDDDLKPISQVRMKGEDQMVMKIKDDDLKPESHARIEGEDQMVTKIKDDDLKPESQVRIDCEDQMVTNIKDNPIKPKETGISDTEERDETNWQELLLGGLDDKEKVLLQEYTSILRKYKAAKKELAEEEQKRQENILETNLQLRNLQTLLAKRDTEIQQIKQNLKLVQEDGVEELSIFNNKSEPVSEIEEKLRTDIDVILDENLDFWLRFSTAFHQVQKFKKQVEDLQQEITKAKTKPKSNISTSSKDIRSDINPIYKHLKEIHNELMIFLENIASLKNELQRRCSSLSNIQEEITTALKEGMEEEEIKFSTHQAAKFQGEVLNMQQENCKVNEELEAGLDHVTAMKVETEETLRRLEEEFGLLDHSNGERQHRPHVPLRSFIFGVKSKKQKPSILACINPHKKFAASDS
ncbi:KIP1-like protein [Cynara cardunculus var. scolymus]|uniref:KIP1-like protein n=1 Tax=Cynara cardunculus var. scolymus TaxID=59895 RepID=A0A103Y5Y7_CYNCS|nr:KIP1-like protein [Cynara cardunculus var. scolymus]